jgi:hypothetical protein
MRWLTDHGSIHTLKSFLLNPGAAISTSNSSLLSLIFTEGKVVLVLGKIPVRPVEQFVVKKAVEQRRKTV